MSQAISSAACCGIKASSGGSSEHIRVLTSPGHTAASHTLLSAEGGMWDAMRRVYAFNAALERA
eukprot:scaffold11300_cov32-Tisochrysis_lutea.AAC.8